MVTRNALSRNSVFRLFWTVLSTVVQAERWGWTPAVRRVREQYRRAIRVHRAQQHRFWRQKWIARFVAAWRAVVGFAAQVSCYKHHTASQG